MMINTIIKLVVGIALIIAAVVLGPIIGIWSLNTLFPVLHIPFTLETWAAFFLLFGSITGLRFGSSK
jgi:multisubunit Na+/H+ antiporter MnhG subunit